MDNERIEGLKKLAARNLDLLIRKDKDYSPDNISMEGTRGIVTRLVDKIMRLRNLTDNNASPNFESIYDTLQDIANYGIIGQMVQEGRWGYSVNLVYLSGPIDGISPTEAHTWRRRVATHLAAYDISVFDPSEGFHILKADADIARKVDAINRQAITNCDLVFAYLDGPGKAFGTIREIEFARSLGKKVIVVCTNLSSLLVHDVEVVPSIGEGLNRITAGRAPHESWIGKAGC